MPSPTLVVVPTFNEADNVGRLVVAIHDRLAEAHVLVVDDASPDGTAAVVRTQARGDARVHVLERHAKLGLGSAYVAGFGWGLARGYQRFFQMDADFSHDPRYLPDFVRALELGADVVVGSRNIAGGGVKGWGPGRHVLSRGGSVYARWLLRTNVRDMTSGYKAYTRLALERMDVGRVRSNGYAFQVETTYLALQAGLRVVELPILFTDRRVGESKLSKRDVGEAILWVWRMRQCAKRR